MSELSSIRSWLAHEIPVLREKYGVPGVSVGVLAEGEIAEAADGVLNLRTRAPVDTASLFQIGSVTKLWTSTLVLQLVEEGLVDLDAPVSTYLTDFHVADHTATAAITVRHLLTHTSGIYGDAFVGTTRDDDAVARYVDEIVPTLAQDIAPGEGLSYSNSAFAVLGRIAEVLRGRPFPALLDEHIANPLGLDGWAATPEDALLHSVSIGHMPDGNGVIAPAPFWNLPPSLGPAGTILSMSPRALLTFAQAHLDDSATLLSPAMIERAWTPMVPVPDIGILSEHWGLGWMVFDWNGTRVVGHDGGTYGQSCCLRLFPEAEIAVSTHANGGETMGFHRAVLRHVARELISVDLPDLPEPANEPEPVDALRMAGRYSSSTTSLEIEVMRDGSAQVTSEALTPEARRLQPEPETSKFVTLDEDRLVATTQQFGIHEVVAFVGGRPGEPATHVFRNGRLTPRSL